MYFDVIEEFITEGDIVLWCPEPGSWTLGSSNCSSRFWDFRKADYGFAQYLDISRYDNLFSSFASNCAKLPKANFKNFDRLSANMSKYGDDLSPRKSKGQQYEYNFGCVRFRRSKRVSPFSRWAPKPQNIQPVRLQPVVLY